MMMSDAVERAINEAPAVLDDAAVAAGYTSEGAVLLRGKVFEAVLFQGVADDGGPYGVRWLRPAVIRVDDEKSDV